MSQYKSMLLAAPDSQLADSVKPLVRSWDDPPKAIQVLEVLDQCVHGGMASGAVMVLLESVIYQDALKRENTTHEALVPLATWRT